MRLPIWTYGFKNDNYKKYKIKMSIPRDVAFILLDSVEKIPQRPKTIVAEKGLGIKPSFYFFINRATIHYGNGVFFFDVDKDGWGENERGVCPFDSGGVWVGRVYTNPAMVFSRKQFQNKKRREFFCKYDRILNDWVVSFNSYIQTNYNDIKTYIEGKPPDRGDGVKEVIKATPPNYDRAWTWEGRIPRDKLKGKAKPFRYYCSNWGLVNIKRSIEEFKFLNLREKILIKKWLKKSTVECEIPNNPISKANEYLKKELT